MRPTPRHMRLSWFPAIAVPVTVTFAGALAGCDGAASAFPPPGPTAALAPAPADPGHAGVSTEVGSGAQGLTGPYAGGVASAPNGPLLDGGPTVPAPTP